MIWYKDEAEVDEMIEKMKSRTKGKHITQGVSFNKECPRQMELLKMALMGSVSFSGLVKELLALKYTTGTTNADISNLFSDTKVETEPTKDEKVVEQPKETPKKTVKQEQEKQLTNDSSLDEVDKSIYKDFMS